VRADLARRVQTALNFVPTRASFLAQFGDHPGLEAEMRAFVDEFGAIVQDLYKWLNDNGLNCPEQV